MLVNLVTEFCVITHRIKIPRSRVFSAMMTNRGDTERGTIRACPNHIWPTELLQDLINGDLQDICIKVDILKILIPLHAKDFMASGLECLADGASSSKQFQYFQLLSLPLTISAVQLYIVLERWLWLDLIQIPLWKTGHLSFVLY